MEQTTAAIFSYFHLLANSLFLAHLPAGLGPQTLYGVTALFTPDVGPAVQAERRIGFRTFALVTGNDTDPDYVKRAAGADGTDTQGMLFRVNGAAVFSRGANMIPMEELEVGWVGAGVQLRSLFRWSQDSQCFFGAFSCLVSCFSCRAEPCLARCAVRADSRAA